MNAEPMHLWTVYDRPRDFPNSCVARLWHVYAGQERPTGEIIVGASVEAVREQLAKRGLTCLHRSDGDDPCIVESWL